MLIKSLLFISSFTLALCSCKEDLAQVAVADVSRSELTQKLLEETGLIHQVFSDTTILLHEGAAATRIHYLNAEGYAMHAFILEIDMGEPGMELAPLTPFGDTAFARQSIPGMLNYVPQESNILAAVNSDFFDMDTGEPRSIVYLKGKAVRTIIPETRSFFGVSRSGQLMMGNAAAYHKHKQDIYHALGGAQWLVSEHAAVEHTNVPVEPRTAVGFTDEELLYFIVVDGRQFDYSNGITFSGLSEMMLAFDVAEAINLDGGGSSTFVINNRASGEPEVWNSPSDGSPRPVANGWAIVYREP